MTESDARKAFHTASTELQSAVSKYQSARTALHRITGEFQGTAQDMAMKFTSTMATSPSEGGDASRIVADC